MSISIIVPCYNEEASLPLLEERLGMALERLAEDDVEVLLIDDGSTDGTLVGLEAMCGIDSRRPRHRPRGEPGAWRGTSNRHDGRSGRHRGVDGQRLHLRPGRDP